MTNIRDIFVSVYPARVCIMNELTATDLATFCYAYDMELTNLEKSRYLLPIRDLTRHEDWIRSMTKKGHNITIMGKDVPLWFMRVKDPHEYWSMYNYHVTIRVWIICLPIMTDDGDDLNPYYREGRHLYSIKPPGMYGTFVDVEGGFKVAGAPFPTYGRVRQDSKEMWSVFLDSSASTIEIMHSDIPLYHLLRMEWLPSHLITVLKDAYSTTVVSIDKGKAKVTDVHNHTIWDKSSGMYLFESGIMLSIGSPDGMEHQVQD